jgi:hypothetical protein
MHSLFRTLRRARWTTATSSRPIKQATRTTAIANQRCRSRRRVSAASQAGREESSLAGGISSQALQVAFHMLSLSQLHQPKCLYLCRHVATSECDSMVDILWLTGQIETRRPYLSAVAYGMLGSTEEADDALQQAHISGRCVVVLVRQLQQREILRHGRPILLRTQ